MSEPHVVPIKLYYGVFATLLALTGLTVAISFVDLGAFNTVAALSIAVIKGLLVLLYFMHLRWSSRLTWIFFAAGLFWLFLLIGGTMDEILTRSWTGR